MSNAHRLPPLKIVHKKRVGTSSFRKNRRLYSRGFTYLELIFVILIIGTLVSVMLVRVLPAIDQAERASVLQLEGQIRGSLAVQAAQYLAAGEQDRVRAMQGMNPMALMLDAPGNYVGEVNGKLEVPRGSWFFRTDLQELRYRPREPSSMKYTERPLGEMAFRVDVAEAGWREGRDIYGVRLSRVSGEDWLVATP